MFNIDISPGEYYKHYKEGPCKILNVALDDSYQGYKDEIDPEELPEIIFIVYKVLKTGEIYVTNLGEFKSKVVKFSGITAQFILKFEYIGKECPRECIDDDDEF